MACSAFRTFMARMEKADNPGPVSAAIFIYPWIMPFFLKTNLLSLMYVFLSEIYLCSMNSKGTFLFFDSSNIYRPAWFACARKLDNRGIL